MEFQKTNLGELSVNGKGSYGIAASAVPYSDELFTYLRITDINDDGTLNKSGLMSVSDEKAEQYLLKPNDIVFARTGGSTGRSYFYDGTDGEFVYAGFLIKFSIDSTKVNPRFIKYYCLSQEYRGWVHSFNTGSTRGNINAQTYANMPILLPSREQQDLLVDTLSVIDEKIKLNTAINENLEQQIGEYFKEMFPDVLNENGKETLGKLISFSNGKKRPDEEGQIPVYGGNGVLAYTNKANASNCVIIGRVGAYCGNVCLSLDDCWISDNAISAKSKISKSQLFVFSILKNAHLPNRHIGSGQPLMTQGILNAIPCIVPKEKEIVDFEGKMIPLHNMISVNNQENQRLAALRDTLLPKLMNGEIDVSAVRI